MKKRFEGKTVFIIGGTGGIGSKLTEKIINEGGRVSVFSKNKEKLEILQNTYGDKVLIYHGNAENFEELKDGVNSTISKFGGLDSVIHSVGSIMLKNIISLTEEQFRSVLELNLVSPFFAIKAALPFMIKNNKGSFVFISSVAGKKGLINHEAISAAKGGLESMIRSAAVTYAKKGIRFNAVSLGLVDTPLASFLTSNDLSLKASTALHPMNRIGTPEDTAEAILHFASDESAWITGAVLPIDGGMAAS